VKRPADGVDVAVVVAVVVAVLVAVVVVVEVCVVVGVVMSHWLNLPGCPGLSGTNEVTMSLNTAAVDAHDARLVSARNEMKAHRAVVVMAPTVNADAMPLRSSAQHGEEEDPSA